MATSRALLVTYNLNDADDGYDALFDNIKRFGQTWHNADSLESVWFVKTQSTPTAVSDAIKDMTDVGDNWFVVDITGSARQGWMPKSLWTWLKK